MTSIANWANQYRLAMAASAVTDGGGESAVDQFADRVGRLTYASKEWCRAATAAVDLLGHVDERDTQATLDLIGYFFESLSPVEKSREGKFLRDLLRAVTDGLPRNPEARAYVLRFIAERCVVINWNRLQNTDHFNEMRKKAPLVLASACSYAGNCEMVKGIIDDRRSLRIKVRDIREMARRWRGWALPNLSPDNPLWAILDEWAPA